MDYQALFDSVILVSQDMDNSVHIGITPTPHLPVKWRKSRPSMEVVLSTQSVYKFQYFVLL